MDRRAFLRTGASLAGTLSVAGCATSMPSSTAPARAWQARLSGANLILLGELHDHHALHAARLAILRAALDGGWRPTVLMEQFDTDRQEDIERARAERPADPDHLIAGAGSPQGWEWPLYRPVVELALRHRLPLYAANLARREAGQLVRAPFDRVFAPPQRATLRLERVIDNDWRLAQEKEMDEGHCGALPPNLLPGMARAQFARDALMAALLRNHGTNGAVLLAGNGHVRRDLGVARWLDDQPVGRVWAVGFVEPNAAADAAPRFDALVTAVRLPGETGGKGDPCAALRTR